MQLEINRPLLSPPPSNRLHPSYNNSEAFDPTRSTYPASALMSPPYRRRYPD